MPMDSRNRRHVYCDESGTTGRFLVYGGIIAPEENVTEICAVLARWRQKHAMRREMKWTKVSRAKLPQYENFVDGFFYYAAQDKMHFNCVVFDTHDPGYRRFYRENKAVGFYKLYYQFLLHRFGSYALSDDTRLVVFLDEFSDLTATRRDTMKIILNRGIRLRWGRESDVVESVESMVSHRNDLLQMADVLMGAVGYQFNGLHRAKGASAARRELAAYIARKAGLRFLSLGTAPKRGDFSIWRYQFKPPRRRLSIAPPVVDPTL